MPTRFRCTGCGNLTRFDVIATRRTREFHHFSVGGELSIDEADILEEVVESVTCRWCGAAGGAIELVEAGAETDGVDLHTESR